MSSSTSSSWQSWTRLQYGPVLLTRCPDCPCMETLKRLTCAKEENGNHGREFVECLSRPQPRKVLRKCGHFEWPDEYVERFKLEVSTDELNFGVPLAIEHTLHLADRADLKMDSARLKCELKKNGQATKAHD
ncbi:hypothetical protein D1007_35615 [Hordeum vulgare]|nr:hypothetical protein D1007_35615 [Hordeum vulgare]